MAKAEASVEELVTMIERGELRLPEMQRRYVWRSPRVRDLLDLLYRGYPSGAILLWETDEAVPMQEFAVTQQTNPYQSTRLLLDGQQRLTPLGHWFKSVSVTFLRYASHFLAGAPNSSADGCRCHQDEESEAD
jgi:hypothetical protein